METSVVISIRELSDAGAARRSAVQWAENQGWNDVHVGRVALVVTELGRNLALHARRGGRLILRPISNGDQRGVEILSLDDGPGMENITRCFRDGFSSIGTAGIGLGAVQRTSDYFALHSQTEFGTALLCELWNESPATNQPAWRFGGVSIPAPNERVCGDRWHELRPRPDVIRLIVADGLGHGEFAGQAAQAAVDAFVQHPTTDVVTLLEIMNDALRTTRGAAVSIAEIDLAAKQLVYAGIGNIAGMIVNDGRSTSLVSMNGTLGAGYRTARAFTHAFSPQATLIMASDGLKSQWSPVRYAGLADRHPSLIAGVLLRDYLRGPDDATVIALKEVA